VNRCDECGFEYDLDAAETTGEAIRTGVVEFVELLGSPGADLRSRRDPGVWSPLEYGCHLRDMLLVQRERVLAARRSTEPVMCTPMGRDERVEHDGYADQDPADVTRQLIDAAALLGRDLDRLAASDWVRVVIYTYPTPSERTLGWVATHTVHEVRHHTLDIRRQLT